MSSGSGVDARASVLTSKESQLHGNLGNDSELSLRRTTLRVGEVLNILSKRSAHRGFYSGCCLAAKLLLSKGVVLSAHGGANFGGSQWSGHQT